MNIIDFFIGLILIVIILSLIIIITKEIKNTFDYKRKYGRFLLGKDAKFFIISFVFLDCILLFYFFILIHDVLRG